MEHDVALPPVEQVNVVCPVADAVTVYPAIAAPLLAGAVHATVTVDVSGYERIESSVGFEGTPAGVNTPGIKIALEEAPEFTAVTRTRYPVPFVSPEMLVVRTFDATVIESLADQVAALVSVVHSNL